MFACAVTRVAFEKKYDSKSSRKNSKVDDEVDDEVNDEVDEESEYLFRNKADCSSFPIILLQMLTCNAIDESMVVLLVT